MQHPALIKIAVLDMYNNEPNQGMRCIKDILNNFSDTPIHYDIFNVRAEAELPDLSYDIYISSGGPGDPHDGDGIWDRQWYDLVDQLWQYNDHTHQRRKYVFFICHSFQMACIHFQLGLVTQRHSTSFGVFPIHKTLAGMHDPLLRDLPDPYFCVDSRNWQVIQANRQRLHDLSAEVLALEKIRPHVALERALMVIRFSNEMVGTQFHPEADAQGMLQHLQMPEKKRYVIETFGEEKYYNMIAALRDPEKVMLTHDTILPSFLHDSVKKLLSTDIALQQQNNPNRHSVQQELRLANTDTII